MTEPWVAPGIRIVVVNRGNMQAAFPLTERDLVQIMGFQLAEVAAKQFAGIQADQPADRPTHPIDPKSRTQLAIQKMNGDYLHANVSLAWSFMGEWDEMEVPEGFRDKYHGKAPFVECNLVDTPIILVR